MFVSGLLAFFTLAALRELNEISSVLLGSGRSVEERAAALLQLVAFAYFIAAAAEAVQPGSTLLSELESVLSRNASRLQRILKDAPKPVITGYKLPEGQGASGFLLEDGNIIWGDPVQGHVNIARANGLLVSETPLPSGRLIPQVKAAFYAENMNGQIGVTFAGAYHTPLPPDVVAVIARFFSGGG